MTKRLIALVAAAITGWFLWDVLRRQISPFSHPFESAASLDLEHSTPMIDDADQDLIASEIEAAIEEPGRIAPADPVELAFLSSALQIDPAVELPNAKPTTESLSAIGYCMRCRAKRDIVDPQLQITDNNRRMARGTCSVCGTTVVAFLKDTGDDQITQ